MNKKNRWIYSGIGVIGTIVVFWIAATLFLSPAYADALPFSMKVRSSLLADYNPDDRKSLFTALRLSILGDSLLDQGLSPEEAEKQRLALEASLDDPVPTATALDFDGNAPLTATPTETPVPTETSVPSATPTKTTVPTKIPTRTKTNTPKPANTAGPADSVKPVVADPGTITPTPGPLGTCSRTISVSNVHVTDAAFSSGMKHVKLKYKVYDNPETTVYAGYIYSVPLTISSGGATGGGWDAFYAGPPGFDLSIYPGFSPLPDYTGGPFKVKVWLITEDNAGNTGSHHFYGTYEMSDSCDDPPPPTDTPVPTDTAPPQINTWSLSPTPGPNLAQCNIQLTVDVLDPAYSEGVSMVEAKHSIPSVPGTYNMFTFSGIGDYVSGPSSDWVGTFGGTIALDPVNSNESFDIYFKVKDTAGNVSGWSGPYSYTMDSSTNCP